MLRTLLGTLIGLLAMLLAAEAAFQVLPVSSATRAGYYIDPHILSYAPDHHWRLSAGWDLRNPQRLTSNHHGFVSAHQFVPDASAVALIGDSYVEAAALDADDRPGAQLERALGGQRKVYAMGAPGTALLDYAERIRYAHQAFGIRDFVLLLERGDMRQALCGSGNVHSQCLDALTLAPRTQTLPGPSPLKRLLRHSALAQYLVGQLKIDPARLLQQAFRRSTPADAPAVNPSPGAALPDGHAAPTMAALEAVSQAFFARAMPHVQGRLVLVLDANRPALLAGRTLADDPQRRRFIDLARAAGAEVVDTEGVYRSHFLRSRLSLDVSPNDQHLNPLGVGLLADAAARALAP